MRGLLGVAILRLKGVAGSLNKQPLHFHTAKLLRQPHGLRPDIQASHKQSRSIRKSNRCEMAFLVVSRLRELFFLHTKLKNHNPCFSTQVDGGRFESHSAGFPHYNDIFGKL